MDNLKFVSLNIRDYLGDLILFLLLGLSINPLFDWLNYQIHALLRLPNNSDILPLPSSFLKVALWIILFLVLKWFWSIISTKISNFFKNRYEIDSQVNELKLNENRFKKEWLFQGGVFPENGGLFISNANSGCLLKKKFLGLERNWKNFEATLEVDFPAQQDTRFEKRLGVIFQAQSLDDYLLLEFYKDQNLLKLRPHIRLEGNWDAPILDLDKNITPIQNDHFTLKIVSQDNIVKVYLNNNRKHYFIWHIPTHVEPWLKQHEAKDTSFFASKSNRHIVTDLYFRNRAGMFGFRAYGNQYAFIKSFSIVNI